jgi:hypothetical protein
MTSPAVRSTLGTQQVGDTPGFWQGKFHGPALAQLIHRITTGITTDASTTCTPSAGTNTAHNTGLAQGAWPSRRYTACAST